MGACATTASRRLRRRRCCKSRRGRRRPDGQILRIGVKARDLVRACLKGRQHEPSRFAGASAKNTGSTVREVRAGDERRARFEPWPPSRAAGAGYDDLRLRAEHVDALECDGPGQPVSLDAKSEAGFQLARLSVDRMTERSLAVTLTSNAARLFLCCAAARDYPNWRALLQGFPQQRLSVFGIRFMAPECHPLSFPHADALAYRPVFGDFVLHFAGKFRARDEQRFRSCRCHFLSERRVGE